MREGLRAAGVASISVMLSRPAADQATSRAWSVSARAGPELASRPLFTEDVPVVVGRGHAFAKRSRVAIEDLALSGLVVRDPAAYLHTLTLSYFAAGGTAPRILMELDNTEACKRVVQAGFGAALLPEMAIRDELRRGDLVVVRVEGTAVPKRTIHALWRAGAEPSATVNALLKTLPRAA